MATTQLLMPNLGGLENGEEAQGWRIEVENGFYAADEPPVVISTEPSRSAALKTLVTVAYGQMGNRSLLMREVDGFWRGGTLLSGSTIELYD